MSDHYHTLGTPRFASEVQVRAAYIRLVKRYHAAPERSGVSDERLREIGVAYGELRHPERRLAYDARLREENRRHDRTVGRILRSMTAPRLLGHVRAQHPGRWLFLFLLPLLAGGVGWATLHHVPAPAMQAPEEAPSNTSGSAASDDRLLQQLEGDYALMATLNEQKQINRAIDRCIAALRANDLPKVRRTCSAFQELEWADDGLARRFRAAQH